MELYRSSHTCGESNFHIVFCPKYRKPIFRHGRIRVVCEHHFDVAAENHKITLRVKKIMDDHVHIFVSLKAWQSPSFAVHKLKGVSASKLYKTDTWGVSCPSPPYYSNPQCGDACEVAWVITIELPENCTDPPTCTNASYYKEKVYLNFTVEPEPDWIGYSLNEGDNETITGNTTLNKTVLTDKALNNLTLYASKGTDEAFEKRSFFYCLGGINHDKKVDIKDIAMVAKLFGALCGDGKYDPDKDLNDDCKIDIKDIAMVAKEFGKIC